MKPPEWERILEEVFEKRVRDADILWNLMAIAEKMAPKENSIVRVYPGINIRDLSEQVFLAELTDGKDFMRGEGSTPIEAMIALLVSMSAPIVVDAKGINLMTLLKVLDNKNITGEQLRYEIKKVLEVKKDEQIYYEDGKK